MSPKKIALIIVVPLLIALFFALDLDQRLTLEGIKTGLSDFETLKAESPLLTAFGFFCFYILATALSIPGATILTLASGALFGFLQGLILVSFASTIGALCAFMVSRYLLRDTVQAKFGHRLSTFNQGIEKEGALYLFTLRLVPLPFFLINLVMGLTPIKARTFYWVSQVGMLAGTAVYVNAGTQLGKLESLSGILSPALIFSFALLGIFPLVAKRVVAMVKSKKAYEPWDRPEQFDRNIVVIGGGAAGLVTAYIGAAVKAKVTLIETHKMGGDCLNFGCVPSKALIKSAKVAHQIQHAHIYGLNDGLHHELNNELKTDNPASPPNFSFKAIMSRVLDIIKVIEPHDSIERYESLGVDVVEGYATIKDPWRVSIALKDGSEQELTTRNIVIAAGAAPFVPPLPGLDTVNYVTSDTLWETFAELESIPKKLVVLGGGPIGCELSQSFARLGSHVTQIEMANQVMSSEDHEVSEYAAKTLQADGVNLLLNTEAMRCERQDDANKVIVKNSEGHEETIEFDYLICAVGRKARLEGYGLEKLGINTDRTVITNDYLETLYPNIFAAGDVAGPYQFTHTAAHQAWYAAVNALFGSFKKFAVDYRVIPRVTFLDPEVARVGLNEQEAKAKGIAYEVTRYGLDDLDRAITESGAEGFVKVLTVPGKDKILGVTIVGQHAGELLAEFVLAMKYNLGLNKILGTIHTYPTWCEANKYVAGEWKRGHVSERLLGLLERYHCWMRGR